MASTAGNVIVTGRRSVLRVCVLGHLAVDYDGHPVEVSGVAGAVLALLSRTPGQVTSVGAVIDGLWGEQPPTRPEKAVASYVSRLRRALSGAGGGVDPVALVVTRAPGYVLDVPPSAIDSAVFETTVAQGRRALAVGQPALAASTLRRALALWRGEALEEFRGHPFARAEAVRLDEVRRSAVQVRIEADLAVTAPGAPPTLIAELESLVASYPHQERLWAQLMIALYRSGRQADALQAYRRARSRLIEDLGVEPGPELRDTERAVLSGDRGLHGTPVRATAVPDSLAGRGSICVGRDEDLARLSAGLDAAAHDRAQAMLVVAPEGFGKTELIAELARRSAERGVVCRYGHGSAALDVLVANPNRLSLVLVDGADELSTVELERVAAWVRASTDRPVLTVATARAVPDQLRDLPRLMLAPLSPTAVTELVRLYAPGSEDDALAAVAGAGGVPAFVHDAAVRWVSDRAGRRVDRAVALAAEPRERLGEATEEIVAGVLDLEQVRARARFLCPARDVVLCPYKGLARFESADADLFHGRERLVAELIARLVGAPLLAVVGASGSGKSSVVRAGLLPALAAGALPGSVAWQQVVVTPTTDLRYAFLDAVPAPTVLVVDQFEEAFTALDAERHTAFVAELVDAAGTGRTTVVLTLRSDFYGRCADHPDLARLVTANTVLVRPMTVDELRSAIERPADLAGLTLEPGLSDLLIDDVRDAPGGLPLLSTSLLALWERRSGRTLTVAAYRETGGVAGAVEQLGERAYAELASDAERETARRILLRLADTGGEHAVVRRKASRAELESIGGAAAGPVLEILATRRLVTVSRDDVQVSHEALMTRWSRLSRWLAEDAAGRELRAHLTPVATAWAESGRDAGELYRGARLAAALDWAAEHPQELTGAERDFLSASQDAALADELDRRRRVHRLRQLLVAAGTALVLALAGGYAALTQQLHAERAARAADAASVVADARRLGAQALVEPDLRKAALLATAATTLDDSPQTTGNLLATLGRSPQLLRVGGVAEGRRLLGLAVSPDGKTLAVSTNDAHVQIYQADTMKLTAELGIAVSGINHFDFTPDGRRLLALGEQESHDGHGLQLWEVGSWRPVGRPFGPSSYVRGSNLGGGVLADGTSVVTADSDGTVGVWSLASGAPLRQLLSGNEFHPAGRYNGVFLAPDRRTVVLNGTGGALVVDAVTGTPRRFPQIAGAFALGPDGHTLLAGDENGDIGVWDLASGTRLGLARRHISPVIDAVWSPDGRTFASTSEDRLTVVWDAASLRPREVLAGAAGRQLQVRYSPDGRTLFTAGQDGGVYAWDLSRQHGLETELDPAGFYSGAANPEDAGPVAFDFPRERAMVLESAAAYAIDLRTGKPTGPPIDLGHDWYRYPTLSGDGRRLALGFADGHGRVWDLPTGRLLLDVGGLSIYDGYSTDPAYDQYPLDMALSADGRVAIFAGYRLDRAGLGGEPKEYSTVVSFYDVDSGARVGSSWIINGVGHNRLTISPDGRYLAVALEDGIGVWDLADHRQAAMVQTGIQQMAVRFSHDGRYLAVDGWDGRPSLFRTGTWERVWRADVGHNGVGVLVSFSPDGRVLASSGGDSKIFLYDVPTGAPISRPLGPDSQSTTFLYAEFRPDRNEIVGYFSNGALHSWDLDPASWVRRACAIAGRDMTPEEWRRVLPARPYRHVCPG